MCTLVIARHVFSEHPLVVASNRDEQTERPSAVPAWHPKRKRIYAPSDLVRGGTWIGISEHGLFAAITNRDEVPHQSGRASRGHLVFEALCAPNANAAVEQIVLAVAHHPYNGFHLVVADAYEAFLCAGDGRRVETIRVEDGLCVVTGYGWTRSHAPRVMEIERRFEEIVRPQGPTPAALDTLLNFHADHRPEHAACVHDPHESHKTVSSMLVRTDREWSHFDTWYRHGPACGGPFDDPVIMSIDRKDCAPWK